MSLPIPFPASTISLEYGAIDGKYYTVGSPHQGTDFSSRSQGVVAGAAFRASGSGVVKRTGYGPAGVTPSIDRPNSLSGNSIDVDYGNVIVRYMHRPLNSPSPAQGDKVVEGSVLGVIGNTGLSSAPHLHMETWDKKTKRRVNPANFFDFTRTASANATSATESEPLNQPLEDDMPKYTQVKDDRGNFAMVGPDGVGRILSGAALRGAQKIARAANGGDLPEVELSGEEWDAASLGAFSK